MIEDPVNGNGLCMVPNKSGKSMYYSRRRNWKANWNPVRESQDSMTYFNIAGNNNTRIGPYAFLGLS